MYAQKRQQKQHHDLVLKPKELTKGDLVVYTLKLHLGKFKNRDFGPCILEEISSSGTVKLSTLNGSTMSN